MNDRIRSSCLLLCGIIFACALFAYADFVLADELVGSSFRVLDPVVFPGSYSTSAGYQLNSVISQISIGTSTGTGNSFNISAGFLYFPFVSTPVVTATASLFGAPDGIAALTHQQIRQTLLGLGNGLQDDSSVSTGLIRTGWTRSS